MELEDRMDLLPLYTEHCSFGHLMCENMGTLSLLCSVLYNGSYSKSLILLLGLQSKDRNHMTVHVSKGCYDLLVSTKELLGVDRDLLRTLFPAGLNLGVICSFSLLWRSQV